MNSRFRPVETQMGKFFDSPFQQLHSQFNSLKFVYMETLIINVPEKKSALVRLLFKELGITIQNQIRAEQLAKELKQSSKPGPKPSLDEIVAEVKEFRAGR